MNSETDSIIKRVLSYKKAFLLAVVWILVAEAVVGLFVILTQQWTPLIGKVQAAFLAVAVGIFMSLASFTRMEHKFPVVRTLGLICFISCLIVTVMWILLIFDVLPTSVSTNNSYRYTISISVKILSIALSVMLASYIGGGLFGIEDNSNIVMPLKLTSLISLGVVFVFSMVIVFSDFRINSAMFYELYGFAILVMVATGIAAVAVSNNVKKTQKKQTEGMQSMAPKTDEELRAEIEEKVRREMIEKEVRAQYEKQNGDQFGGPQTSGQ